MDEKVLLEHKVILHIANANDLPEVFELVDDYDGEIAIDKTKTKNNLREIVYMQGAMLFEYEGTIIGGVAAYVCPCMFTNDVIYTAMFFYVREQFRFLTVEIIKEMELVLLPTKVTKIVFGVPIIDNKNAHKLIRRFKMLGYEPLETHMYKRISNA